MSRIYIILWLLVIQATGLCSAYAQNVISGIVIDDKSEEPVEMATIQLTSVNTGKLISYVFTDKSGKFEIKYNSTDSLQISVSSLGFKSLIFPFKQVNLTIRLEPQPFSLQEVVVRPGRVWSSKDTINYDVDQFIAPKDESIRDVLEKLPGINVDEVGKISYNGKDISRFYVEGMDPVNGRYNQISNNLRAEAVQSVQIMENHQAIKMLENIVASEDIALNLKLKSEFRDVWMFSLEGAIGASPLLREVSANAIQLGRSSQSIYSYKNNNTGKDITNEQNMLIDRRNSLFDAPSTPSFLTQPSIMAPLKKERLLFNDIHSLTANQLYKLNETTQMRVNANYAHDKREQERGSETIYYQLNDTISITERTDTKLHSDEASLNIFIENNASDKFLTNNFKLSGNWNKSMSDYTGSLVTFQNMNSTALGGSNDFRNIWKKKDNRYELRSLLQYNHQPERLQTDDVEQKTVIDHLYTDHSFSITRLKGYFTIQNSFGFTGDLNSIQNGGSLYAIPSVQWNKDKWQTSFRLPFLWTTYPGKDFSRWSVRPDINIIYKLNYAWRFSLSARYNERYGDILNFYNHSYYVNYRQTMYVPDRLSVQQIQNYTVYGEYKKTSGEFFTTLSLSHMRSENSHIYEHSIENGYIAVIPQSLSNWTTNWRVNGTVSKGFYDLGLQTSLLYRFNLAEGEQISKTEILPYQTKHMELEPKINWSYWHKLNITYSANINLAGSTVGDNRLNQLWNILQKLQLSYEITPIEINLSVDHYYNEINNTNAYNNVFPDIAFRWKLNKWKFTFTITNILDTRQYNYTEYSAIQSYSSWINIRGREFLLGVQYKF